MKECRSFYVFCSLHDNEGCDISSRLFAASRVHMCGCLRAFNIPYPTGSTYWHGAHFYIHRPNDWRNGTTWRTPFVLNAHQSLLAANSSLHTRVTDIPANAIVGASPHVSSSDLDHLVRYLGAFSYASGHLRSPQAMHLGLLCAGKMGTGHAGESTGLCPLEDFRRRPSTSRALYAREQGPPRNDTMT